VGEIKVYRILFERTVGKLSPGKITGSWVGTVKMGYQNTFMLCEMDSISAGSNLVLGFSVDK